MFGNDRTQLRQQYFDVWQKLQNREWLTPLESQIADVIEKHSEYHFIFKAPEKYLQQDYFPELGETNPFLHMSLHIALIEQLSTNRPPGINEYYQLALSQSSTEHEAQHLLINALVECMWQAQQEQRTPTDDDFLYRIKAKIKQ